MRFFLSPFVFVFELIGFLISAAFVYGLALIVGVAILWYGISTIPKTETEYIETVVTETVYVPVEETVERIPELTCIKLSGCKINADAKTEEEYCPTCVMK